MGPNKPDGGFNDQVTNALNWTSWTDMSCVRQPQVVLAYAHILGVSPLSALKLFSEGLRWHVAWKMKVPPLHLGPTPLAGERRDPYQQTNGTSTKEMTQSKYMDPAAPLIGPQSQWVRSHPSIIH